MTVLAQNDFCSLTLSQESDDSKMDLLHHFGTAPQSTARKEQKVCCDDSYVPVNFIPESVYSMIKAWELSELGKQDVGEVSDVTVINRMASAGDELNSIDYEPIRFLREVVPPKRFYRTFWRSITRKILESQREAVPALQRASTS